MRSKGKRRPSVTRVAAGLILHRGRFLITRRNADTHLGGFWEFPGGKCGSDEALEDCLRRELREELGIGISAPTPLRTIRHRYPDRSVELHFFLCSIGNAQAHALGRDDLRWATPEELADFEFPAANRPLIEKLRSGGVQRRPASVRRKARKTTGRRRVANRQA